MKTSVDQRSRRKLIALTVSGVLLATLAAVGGYGLIVGTAEKPAPTATPRDPAPPTQPSPRPPTASRPKAPPIAPTRDPELFARRIAEAIFAWDTAAGLMPLDYTAAILAAGDTSGNEQAGIAADIATYLPTRDAWQQLRKYETTQRLKIDTVSVPDAWAEALAQARPGQLPPGAGAYTIDGVREREGTWNGSPETLNESVSFTVFIACPSHKDPCYLLRLSQLGSALR